MKKVMMASFAATQQQAQSDSMKSDNMKKEIKELSVPVNKLDALETFYRVIASNEQNTAVLKPAGQ